MQHFEFEGNQIRTLSSDGDPLFVLKDVCEILDLGQVAGVVRRLSKDVISNHPLKTAGGSQMAYFINEDGLYDVMLESRKPEARAFRKWVTSEVLPTIRKHGAYMTPDTLEKALLSPSFLKQLAEKLEVEQTARIEAENARRAAEFRLDEQRPLVAFAETCMTSDKSLLIREVAKLISKNDILIGERRLYNKLREWGFVCKDKPEPTQRGMEMGLFEVAKGVRQTPKGARDWQTTKVTPKGQAYIANRLQKEA